MQVNLQLLAQAVEQIESQFLPLQRRWISDPKKFLLCRKPVRCGWTYCHSWKMMKKRLGFFRDPRLPPIREVFVSKNLKTSSEYMGYLRKWGQGLEGLFPGLIDLSTWTSEIARLPGGNIEIFSSDPDGFRGIEGDITLDEIDFHDQQAALYASASSRADWIPDGQISLFSSRSYNPATWFATFSEDLIRNPDPLFSVYNLNLDHFVAEGLHRKQPGEHQRFLDGTPEGEQKCIAAFYKFHRSKCASEEDYRREYYWDASGQFQLITPSVYAASQVGSVGDSLDGTEYDDLFVGIDCGRSHDLTVVWVWERGYHKSTGLTGYRPVCIKSLRNLPFPQQHELIATIIGHESICGGYIDQGAQGRALADSVHAMVGDRIKPIGFNQLNKGEMAERLRAFAQSKRCFFPDDIRIKQDIQCVVKSVTENKTLKYSGSTRESHGDWFWSAALGLWAAEGGKGRAQILSHEPAEATA